LILGRAGREAAFQPRRRWCGRQQGRALVCGISGRAEGNFWQARGARKGEPSYLRPIIRAGAGLTDRSPELNMGQTAEVGRSALRITGRAPSRDGLGRRQNHKLLANGEAAGFFKGRGRDTFRPADWQNSTITTTGAADSTPTPWQKLKSVSSGPGVQSQQARNSSQLTRSGAIRGHLASEDAVKEGHGLAAEGRLVRQQGGCGARSLDHGPWSGAVRALNLAKRDKIVACVGLSRTWGIDTKGVRGRRCWAPRPRWSDAKVLDRELWTAGPAVRSITQSSSVGWRRRHS